jgi:hypothetical protein
VKQYRYKLSVKRIPHYMSQMTLESGTGTIPITFTVNTVILQRKPKKEAIFRPDAEINAKICDTTILTFFMCSVADPDDF